MKVCELAERLSLTGISTPEEDREVSGVYIGDLLSWVMGRAESGCAWITIMSNVNIVAVASLADVACIVLAEGVLLEDDVRRTAEQEGVNIFSSPKTAYELAVAMSDLLK